ncbi:MAG TPA: RNase H family protein [Longimicrobiales bacterium]|nr:RNase H family protein [Longimicrobiales bacterium]
MEPLVFLYADESCLGNQNVGRDSPGGAGVLLEHWRGDGWERRDAWLSEPATTNNCMAIRSGIIGLAALKRPSRVVFTSDSSYLVNGMSQWIHGWARRGWKRKTGAVENAELWKELCRAAAQHRIEWRWVRGHAGHPQNEYANHLATRAAKKQDSSNGALPSGFEAWLSEERDRYERYIEYIEHAAPEPHTFRPAETPPL